MHDLLEMQIKIEAEQDDSADENNKDANNNVMDDILKELDHVSQLSEVREESDNVTD